MPEPTQGMVMHFGKAVWCHPLIGPFAPSCQVPCLPITILITFLVYLELFSPFKYRTLEIANPLFCSSSLIFKLWRKKSFFPILSEFILYSGLHILKTYSVTE